MLPVVLTLAVIAFLGSVTMVRTDGFDFFKDKVVDNKKVVVEKKVVDEVPEKKVSSIEITVAPTAFENRSSLPVVEGTGSVILDVKKIKESESVEKEVVFPGLVYPGARLIENQGDGLQIYEVDVDVKTVGAWYKDVFDSNNFRVKNYISTVTNGEVQILMTVTTDVESYSVAINQGSDFFTDITIKTLDN